jgi:hypothetical protein
MNGSEERRAVHLPTKKGVMIPGNARRPSSSSPTTPTPTPQTVVTIDVDSIISKVVDTVLTDGCVENVLDVFIRICKEKKVPESSARAVLKPICEVVNAILKMTLLFIEKGVPTTKSGDQDIEALRKVFEVLPSNSNRLELFRICCGKACKFAAKERAEIRAEKAKKRSAAAKAKQDELLKPKGEHVGKKILK